MMALDMVGDRRRHDTAALQANLAQWLKPQLIPPPALPLASCVPTMYSAFMGHAQLSITALPKMIDDPSPLYR
jgi:hypothetical protein